jgi:hypothetical protein
MPAPLAQEHYSLPVAHEVRFSPRLLVVTT